MKILYFSDEYAYEVMGTKRSIAEQMKALGHDVVTVHRREIEQVIQLIVEHNPDQVWLSHSSLMLPKGLKQKIAVPVVGFGFSDPYYFTEERFDSYDAYITNHYDTYIKYQNKLPIAYNPTACDFRFHRSIKLEKTIDASCIGVAVHPRFHNSTERIEFVDRLRKDLGCCIKAYGKKWPRHRNNYPHIEGQAFLEVINSSRIGLDLQDDWSPLAHRMFEYSACGVPVITRERPEVRRMFDVGTEILTYTDYASLRDTVRRVLASPSELESIGGSARLRCEREHNISHRVDRIVEFTTKLSRSPT